MEKLPASEALSLNNLSQVRQNEDYWAVTLDDKIINTMFKDAQLLPSRALALAMAEEWEAQQDILDIKALHLNSMVAKGIRSMHDLQLITFMQNEIYKILENDQICFVEPDSSPEENLR